MVPKGIDKCMVILDVRPICRPLYNKSQQINWIITSYINIAWTKNTSCQEHSEKLGKYVQCTFINVLNNILILE